MLNSSRKAFSMLELLVAMTVIAIVCALLLPAFQAVRSKTRTLDCAMRLRTWGVSFQLYASDHKGFYPPTWISSKVNYSVFMAPYMPENWLYTIRFGNGGWTASEKRLNAEKAGCPEVFRQFAPPNNDYQYSYYHPYSYNSARMDYPWFWKATTGPEGPYSSGTQYSSLAFVANPQPPYVFNEMGWQVAPSPDRFPYVGPDVWFGRTGAREGINKIYMRYIGEAGNDTAGYYSKRTAPHTVLYDLSKSVAMFCGRNPHWRFGSNPNVAGWSEGYGWDCRTDIWWDNHGRVMGMHGGSDNFLFMDGHVETLKLNDPNLNKYIYGKIPANGNPYS